MSDPTPDLQVEQRGAVLWLTIQREARRNAMSHAVLAGMAQAITAAQTNRSVRAIVITGAGSKAFCAGADLQSANAFTTDYSEPLGHLAQLLRVVKASNVPLIARVNGACMAGGMGLLAMCDMAVAAPPRHLRPAGGQGRRVPGPGAQRAATWCPAAVLAEMCLTGEPITARGAGIRPGQPRQRDDLDAGVQAAGAPARQIARRHPARPVH
jgi:enoyl-CoA hydratase/carnithine racemase